MSDHDPTYAAKLVSLLERASRSPPTFIDVGACRGDFSALLSGAFPGAVVHAFEPNPALIAALEDRFRATPQVHVRNTAIHEERGTLPLWVHADPGTSSLLPRSTNARRYFHSSDRVAATVPVPTISLDDFLDAELPNGVTLLKLDTQGAELAILRGAISALAAAAIDVIYTEFFLVPHYAGAPLLADLMALLARYGYLAFDIFKGPYARNGQLRFGDAIFVSPAFRARHLDSFPEEP